MLKTIIALSAISLLVSVVWLNYIQLVEAFGSGPPYYGRTTNMDKWTNPIPLLVIVDSITLLIIIFLVRLGTRNSHSKQEP